MVRLSIPDALLLELKAMQAARRARLAVIRSRKSVAPVSSDQVPKPADESSAMDRVAANYVAGMDALQREVEEEMDAFLLDPGMGPMTYLASDGRVIFDHRTWDGSELEFAESLDDAIPALVVGAKKTGIAALLDLIPSLSDGETCPKCDGRRWAKLAAESGAETVCPVCRGRGQADHRLLSEAKSHGWL
jgi:hypothetical protein